MKYMDHNHYYNFYHYFAVVAFIAAIFFSSKCNITVTLYY